MEEIKPNKKTRLNLIVNYLLLWLLAYVAIHEIILGEYLYASAAISAIIVSFIPAFILRNYRITMPWLLEFLILLALSLHIIGNSFRLYHNLRYYDIMMHIFGTSVVAILAFHIVFALHYSGRIKVTVRMIGIFIFTFAIAIGALWEIGEFATDHLLLTNAQMTWINPAAGLFDTNTDLIFDTLAGAIVAIGGMNYIRRKEMEKSKKQSSNYRKKSKNYNKIGIKNKKHKKLEV
ncbi:MAG: hypothetical protein QXK37_05300 [Candidatus Woesearchaeota archaeon]